MLTREQIIAWAREQGLPETATEGVFIVNSDDLGRFAALVRAQALEEVADMVNACDRRATPKGIAAAIRAREEP